MANHTNADQVIARAKTYIEASERHTKHLERIAGIYIFRRDLDESDAWKLWRRVANRAEAQRLIKSYCSGLATSAERRKAEQSFRVQTHA